MAQFEIPWLITWARTPRLRREHQLARSIGLTSAGPVRAPAPTRASTLAVPRLSQC